MSAKLTVDNTISMLLYEAKQDYADVFNNTTTNTSEKIFLKRAVLTDTGGTLEDDSSVVTEDHGEPFDGAIVGDVITFIPSYDTSNAGWGNSANKVWSFQLLDKSSNNKGYVSQAIGNANGANLSLNGSYTYVSQKNEGLVGTYKASKLSNNQLSIRQVNSTDGTFSRRIEDVCVGDLVYYTDLNQFYAATANSTHVEVAHDGKPAVVTEVTNLTADNSNYNSFRTR